MPLSLSSIFVVVLVFVIANNTVIEFVIVIVFVFLVKIHVVDQNVEYLTM